MTHINQYNTVFVVCINVITVIVVDICNQHNGYSVCRLPEDRIVIFNILPELCVAGHDQMDWVVHQMYHHQVYTMRLAAVSHQLVDFKVYPSRDQLHRHESEPVWMVEVDHVYASTAITASQVNVHYRP
ncbi:hypothetical protein BATDEDRAFT_21940 [Batrachochytrium dendrobatidis JAM81]|uniref:Uncharacterized protein n=1 Tax=Batrachochytrium dendrobatidis (strain JAM81 / FGSC 10211) TaxID=684364 RepID=F4NRG6_BATDJ|nr:uncharacterized protein BATDEDRAFT_21940 [Batrachochytrium dendrobatidis JAM81]EGF83336.1 hypothetical protein BATDEDRAFT_21940 [Batrachochytrium dendrobatidis JAM81]|eukprot:XP_006675422.1 hypothetical protein BATDEDRAFT_21940 [Batrachochytrium dendrobatidis JAM81]